MRENLGSEPLSSLVDVRRKRIAESGHVANNAHKPDFGDAGKMTLVASYQSALQHQRSYFQSKASPKAGYTRR